MNWLLSLDVTLFRFINGALSNCVFDKLMPFLSGNGFFIPAVLVVAIALLWKGGARGRIFVVLAVTIVIVGDDWLISSIKESIGRPRPFVDLPDVKHLVGRGKSNSMPSSHAANWFAATMIALIFYRRSWRFMLPIALVVSFSRIYVGVHYPSDVVVGAILGAGYGAAFVWLANAIWHFAGKRWFPLWWKNYPSLISPAPVGPLPAETNIATGGAHGGTRSTNSHWLRLGYIFIFALLAFRLIYIASGTIELSEDEAYQWVWSKHLALSYYSKPPLIAYTQFLGTSIFGDTELGVRFFSPVIAAILAIVLLRFMARQASVRVGLALVAILSTTPLTSVGSVLMTIDPLSVLFWTLAMLAGWRAVQDAGTTRQWVGVGLWMGLGFLSKYTNLFQALSWFLFFALWPAARKHLRRPGPYVALSIVALSLVPVLIWNAQHGWVTVEHLADSGNFEKKWKPTLRYLVEFFGAELGLLNPIYFIGTLWATIAFWRSPQRNPLYLFLFSMGAPVFLFYVALGFKSRIFPNWIAPSVVPFFCLMVVHFHSRWEINRRKIKSLFVVGLGLGVFATALLHDTDLIPKLFKRTLPAPIDPLRRVRGWRETANAVEEARQKLAAEGRPVFVIGDHYGITGQLSFYLPEAKQRVQNDPLVYFRSAAHPKNQFYFWPGYEMRKGQNAIYVQQVDPPKPERGWLGKWVRGEKFFYSNRAEPEIPPKEIRDQFVSVTDTGIKDVTYHRRVLRRIQIFECRDLK